MRSPPWLRRLTLSVCFATGVGAAGVSVAGVNLDDFPLDLLAGVLLAVWVLVPYVAAAWLARDSERTTATLLLLLAGVAAGGARSIDLVYDALHRTSDAWGGIVPLVLPVRQLTMLAGLWIVMGVIEGIGLRRGRGEKRGSVDD